MSVSTINYRFKIFFRIRRAVFLDEELGSTLLTRDDGNAEIRLYVQGCGPLPNGIWGVTPRPDDMRQFVIIGEPYESELAARNAALNAKKAVLVWSAKENFGVDFYSGLSSQANVERLDEHVLNVYIDLYPGPAFPLQDFSDTFSTSFHSDRCNAKQMLALEIFSASHFDRSPMSQFVTRVTAIEVLMEQKESSDSLKTWIENLKKLSKTESALGDSDRDQLLNALGYQKTESKTRAGMRLATELLPDKTYDQMTSASLFKELYTVRSKIVHDGHHGTVEKDFESLFGLCCKFLSDLLLASIASEDPC